MRSGSGSRTASRRSAAGTPGKPASSPPGWRDACLARPEPEGLRWGRDGPKAYVYDRTFAQNDITPIEKTGTLGANPFQTTNGSRAVTVTHASHTRVSGSTVRFSGATAIGGLTLNGSYPVLVVTGAKTDNGTFYQFDPATLATNGRALKLTNAPANVRAMFITEEPFVFALCDNMTVRWQDQENPTDWTPVDSSTANQRQLTDGTKLRPGVIDSAQLTVTPTDKLTDPRVAGRYMALTLASDAVNGTFRLGKPTAFIKDGGARR